MRSTDDNNSKLVISGISGFLEENLKFLGLFLYNLAIQMNWNGLISVLLVCFLAALLLFGFVSYPLYAISYELHQLRGELAVVKDVDNNLSTLRNDISHLKRDIEVVEETAEKSWFFKWLLKEKKD